MISMERKTGTTIVGIKGKDFVVLAAERQETYGPMKYLEARKIINIYKDIWMATAGMVADIIHLGRILSLEARRFELERGYPPTVRAMATLLSNYLYSKRFDFQQFTAAFIVGGKDSEGFHLFVLGSAGEIQEIDKYVAEGSGMFYALPILDSEYREDMTEEEAVELAVKAVRASVRRDIFSGKAIDVCLINKEGSKLMERVEVEKVVKNAGSGGNKE